MTAKAKLTKEDILHLATLSQLMLNDSEITELTQKLEETVEFVENISEIDTKGFEGTYHSTDNINAYRKDEVDESRRFDQETALKNTDKVKKGMFVVERILHDS